MRVVAVQHFRCHEVRRACVRFHMVRGVLSQAEIDQSHFAIGAKHYVLGLNIAMSDAKRVTVLESLQALMNYFSCLALSIRLALFDALFMTVKEFTSCAQLHHQINVMLVIVRFEVLHDVWMVNFLKQIDLIHNMYQIFLRHLVLVQHLYRHLELRVFLVDSLVYFAEGSLPKYGLINVIGLFQLMHTG